MIADMGEPWPHGRTPGASASGASAAGASPTAEARSRRYSTCNTATLRLVPKGSPDACRLTCKLSGSDAKKQQLVLDNGLVIGPKWDEPRNAWNQWWYIDLAVGDLTPDSIEVMSMRVSRVVLPFLFQLS